MLNDLKRKSVLSQLKSASVLLGIMVMLTGCGGNPPEVDLDRVLEVFEASLKEPSDSAEAQSVVQDVTPTTQQTNRVLVAQIDPTQQKAELNQAFFKLISDKLNDAKLHSKPLAVRMDQSGSIIGFTDENKNMRFDRGDKDIFKIEVDADRGRVVATDLVDPTIHRDRRYTGYYRHGGGGFWMGYMLGSMRGSQYGYYRSYPARRTNFSTMNMAPTGYAKPGSGYQSPRARSNSARSRGGSRSFRGGK